MRCSEEDPLADDAFDLICGLRSTPMGAEAGPNWAWGQYRGTDLYLSYGDPDRPRTFTHDMLYTYVLRNVARPIGLIEGEVREVAEDVTDAVEESIGRKPRR